MAQSSYYADFNGIADGQYTTSLDLVPTQLDEDCLSVPQGVFHQQWPTQAVESTHDHDWTAAWPAPSSWDPADQQHQFYSLAGATSDHTALGWTLSPGSDQMSYHQQSLLTPQPASFASSVPWSISSLSHASTAPSPWESFPDSQSPPLSGTQPLRHSIERTAVPTGPSEGPEVDIWGGHSKVDSSSKRHKKKAKRSRKEAERLISHDNYDDEVDRHGSPPPAAKTPHSDEAGSSSSSPPARKKPHPVRNRAAAKRCREKMKQYERDLVDRDREVAEERAYLDECVSALRCEVLSLKDQILQHGNCKCEAIQRYIVRKANEVSQSAV
ncbi:basic region leucine zipper [Colletotrichum musicola]|uniref:Basic region leucine zipper n=1 Tax=Colletotrichum musicola TaxID=2175873 RepID=A0A8H6JTI6_9PEZI|nr:basic region leucine zipper [Colletotrichum musicola]